MRWITRVFVSAAVRRIAVICVLALLGWLGIGTARATNACPPGGSCDAGTAYSDCMSGLQEYFNTRLAPSEKAQVTGLVCEYTTGYSGATGYAWYWGKAMTGNSYYDSGVRSYFLGTKTCSSRPQTTGKPWQSSAGDIRDGTVSCESGCETTWFSNGDGTSTGMPVGQVCKWDDPDMCSMYPGSYWNSQVMGCEYPEPETCPAGQQKNAAGNCVDNKCPSGMVEGPAGTCINEKNECPAGEVKSPTGQCLPGDGQCAQGEARRPNGTCGKDSDGDGVADDDDDNPDNDTDKETFSGGDNCNSPPSCSGSPVACGMARIQWRIECNTRRNETVSGGSCSSMPICKGEKCNAMEYTQLLQQWKAACALEKLASQQPGQGGGGDNSDLIAYLSSGGTVNTDAMGNGGIEVGDPWGDGTGSPGDDFQPDGSGFGYSSSCPTFPVVNVMGTSLDFNNGPLCDWLALGGQLVLILAALASLRIVAGSAA